MEQDASGAYSGVMCVFCGHGGGTGQDKQTGEVTLASGGHTRDITQQPGPHAGVAEWMGREVAL